MGYPQALAYIYSFTDLETAPRLLYNAANYDLRRMEALLALLGHPERAAASVHIAGTKGKGSTAAMVASVLTAAGHRTGLFTSPHLYSLRERLQVDGQPIPEAALASLVEQARPAVEAVHREGARGRPDTDRGAPTPNEVSVRTEYRTPHGGESAWRTGRGRLTTFEVLTALAFTYFREQGASFQVVEVGLGGRLDATNVLEPRVAVITPISYDHEDILGHTLSQIATEKAGIIKPEATVVVAPQPDEALEVIQARCQEQGAHPILVGQELAWEPGPFDLTGQKFTVRGRAGDYRLRIPLLGRHQVENAATAVATLEALGEQGVDIARSALERGLASVRWPGRLEVLSTSPLLVVDGAHNGDSARRLRQAVAEYFHYGRLILVMGASQDKNILALVRELAPVADAVVVTRSRHPRSAAPEELARVWSGFGCRADVATSVPQAVDQALGLAGPGDMVLVTGSLFVVAEVPQPPMRRGPK